MEKWNISPGRIHEVHGTTRFACEGLRHDGAEPTIIEAEVRKPDTERQHQADETFSDLGGWDERELWVTYKDGDPMTLLFMFYEGETPVEPKDFIGLTAAQAQELQHQRVVAFAEDWP